MMDIYIMSMCIQLVCVSVDYEYMNRFLFYWIPYLFLDVYGKGRFDANSKFSECRDVTL